MSRGSLVGLLFTVMVLTQPARAQETRRPTGTRFALLAGVDKYAQLQKLEYSSADVTDLAKVLVESAGYRADHVVLMTQAKSAQNLRFAPEAKKIRRELETLLSLCEPADSVLIALAGHGVQFQGESENYFCPADAELTDKSTLVPLGEVYRELEKCKAGFKLLLVDACRDDPRQAGTRAAGGPKIEDVVRLKHLPPPGGVAAFFSCAEGEKAFEHPDLKHGVFFHYVMEGLKGQAADKDGQVELPDLEKYVKREVKAFVYQKYGVSQRPEIINKTQDLVPLIPTEAALCNKGLEYKANKEYDKALAALSGAIRANPDYCKALIGRAWIYNEKDEFDLAIADCNKAIGIEPGNKEAFVERAYAKSRKRDFDAALSDMAQALQIDPHSSKTYRDRGDIYRYMRERDKAIADYTEAIRLDPKSIGNYNFRGNVYSDKGDYDKAIADYMEVIRLDPKNAWAYNNRGIAYREKRNFGKAIADYTEALRLDPKNAVFFYNRGNTYSWPSYFGNDKWDYDKAIADYTEAIRLDPKFAPAYSNRASAYREHKEVAKAEADERTARELAEKK
jgi:tetratricopeptide (TPR) repeat protein